MQKSVGSRQSAQTTFAAFKDTQSKSFRKKATDAAAAAPTTTAGAKPVRPTRPAKPPKPQNLMDLDNHRVRKGNDGVVDSEENEKEEEPEELPSWTRPQRMDSGTFQQGGANPGVALVPHQLSEVFEEEDGEKDAEDEAGDSANLPPTSFRATGAPVRAGRTDSGTVQRKVTKRRQTPPL